MTNRAIAVRHIPGLTSYADGFALQDRTRKEVESGDVPSTLLLLEHSPVITLGRNAHESNLLESRSAFKTMGIDVVETDRGGDVTYHGPGQLVAYPVINLANWKPSVGWYLRRLEETLIRTLNGYGLRSERVEGMTGVWVNGAKVAAVGVGVRNWITFHGIALNVDPNMEHFGLIVPCGIADKPVTSLRALLGDAAPDMASVSEAYAASFQALFSGPIE